MVCGVDGGCCIELEVTGRDRVFVLVRGFYSFRWWRSFIVCPSIWFIIMPSATIVSTICPVLGTMAGVSVF